MNQWSSQQTSNYDWDKFVEGDGKTEPELVTEVEKRVNINAFYQQKRLTKVWWILLILVSITVVVGSIEFKKKFFTKKYIPDNRL